MTNRQSFSNYASSASMEGLLEKHSGLIGTLLVKKYWCVLNEDKLSYFKDPNKTAAPQGTLDVAKIQSVRMSSAKGFCFEITSGSKTQVFAAPSADLRDRWIKSLQDAMSIASRRPSMLRASVSSWRSFEEEEPRSPVDQVSTPPPVVAVVNPFKSSALSVNVESDDVGDAERSSSYRMSTSDASASRVSKSQDRSDVPYKGYVNGPQSGAVTTGTVEPGPRYVESSDSDEEPQPSTTVELSTRASWNPDKSSETPVDVDVQGLPTHSKYLSVVSEQGVVDLTDGTCQDGTANTDYVEVSEPRDSTAEHGSISGSNKLQRETEVVVTSHAVNSVVEDTVSVLPEPTPVAISSEYHAQTAPDELEKQVSKAIETVEKPPQSAPRMVQRRETVTAVDRTAADDTVVVELIVDNSFVPSTVPELQHGRITSEHNSPFDELKSYIAHFHSTDDSYVRPTQRFSNHPGNAIKSLKFFLANIEY